jgi:hypothetical protein
MGTPTGHESFTGRIEEVFMFKRIMLALTFIAAFSTVGVGLSNQAQAWRGGYYYGRPYGAYYAPRAVYYGPAVVPYRAYYGPRIVQPYPVYMLHPHIRFTTTTTTPPRRA